MHNVDAYSLAVLALHLTCTDESPLSCRSRWAAKHLVPLITSAEPVGFTALQRALEAGQAMAIGVTTPLPRAACATQPLVSDVVQYYCSEDDAKRAAGTRWPLAVRPRKTLAVKVLKPKQAFAKITGCLQHCTGVHAGSVRMRDVSLPDRKNVPYDLDPKGVGALIAAVETAAADGAVIYCSEEHPVGFVEKESVLVPVLVNARLFDGAADVRIADRVRAGDVFLPLLCHYNRAGHDHLVAVATELWARVHVLTDEPVDALRDATIANVTAAEPDMGRAVAFASLYGVLLHVLPYMRRDHVREIARTCLVLPHFTAGDVMAATVIAPGLCEPSADVVALGSGGYGCVLKCSADADTVVNSRLCWAGRLPTCATPPLLQYQRARAR